MRKTERANFRVCCTFAEMFRTERRKTKNKASFRTACGCKNAQPLASGLEKCAAYWTSRLAPDEFAYCSREDRQLLATKLYHLRALPADHPGTVRNRSEPFRRGKAAARERSRNPRLLHVCGLRTSNSNF